ncbi:recombinase family protein [Bacillus sp. CGMCC 1.16607]|uniref:recombinase family protein n=1 Tax=Bacillus sp. CGMCC 1.16607 TaxID=3351842 RepID=UPI00363E8FBF
MLKAIGYARKSIIIKGFSEERSVGYQLKAINDYIDNNNMKLVHTYSDIGVSGKELKRPELDEMLRNLQTGKVVADTLLIYSVDRLSRDLEGNIELFLEIIKYVKTVTFLVENFSSDSKFFKIFFTIYAGMADENHKKLLETLSFGRKSKVMQRKLFNGNYHAIGYTKNKNGYLVPAHYQNTNDTEEQIGILIVQYIFNAYLNDMSLREIASKLNDLFGLTRRGKSWTYKSVAYVLTNKVYIGVLEGVLEGHIKYYLKDAHIEPLVDPITFELIQQKLSNEHRGRKSKTMGIASVLTQCSHCMNPLETKGDNLICTSCGLEGNKGEIKDIIERESSVILNEKLKTIDTNKIKDELTKINEVKVKNLTVKINDLAQRQSMINSMNLASKSKENMIEANTNLIQKFSYEVNVAMNVLEYLSKFDHNSSISNELRQYLITYPYLVLIDLDIKKITITYHSNNIIREGIL